MAFEVVECVGGAVESKPWVLNLILEHAAHLGKWTERLALGVTLDHKRRNNAIKSALEDEIRLRVLRERLPVEVVKGGQSFSLTIRVKTNRGVCVIGPITPIVSVLLFEVGHIAPDDFCKSAQIVLAIKEMTTRIVDTNPHKIQIRRASVQRNDGKLALRIVVAGIYHCNEQQSTVGDDVED